MKNNILVIDDEAQIRMLLSEALTAKGYRVAAVQSGHEARRQVQDTPPDLIICDLQMEDTDGLALIQEIKKKLPDVPVILLTGVIFDQQTVENTIQKLVTLYLDKTTPLREVIEAVHRLCSQSKAA